MAARRRRLETCLKLLGAATAQPERFLSVQDGLAADFSSLTKTLYDLHKALGTKVVRGSPLKKLVIKNFDEEQIWQQIELQNNAVLHFFKKAVVRDVKDKDLYLFPAQKEDDFEADTSSEKKMEKEDNIEAEPAHIEDESEAKEKQSKSKARKRQICSDEDSDVDFDVDELEQQVQKLKKSTRKKSVEKSIVDDKFFSLSEMEAFLDDVEKEESKKKDDDEEEEINYFEDIFSDEDEEESEKDKIKPVKSSRNLKYKDFFDPVDDNDDLPNHGENNQNNEEGDTEEEEDEEDIFDETEESNEMDVIEQNEKAKEVSKKVTFNLPEDSEKEDNTDIPDEKKTDPTGIKSSFEKRQEKMHEKIKSLENKLLEEKPWQLTGEVTGQKRPENSLLEESLLFEHAVRMAPVITEETTFQLEDIIKQRIKDQAWDDVIRKEKPKEDAFEYKKRLTLDHEKSKLSLAEIYEQEYLTLNQKKTEEEENPEHVEIQKMMDTLFLKLDALSNFHFTPKPPVPEVKIISNLPAITMEEVAPVSVSDAALLAPEEVKEKSKAGDVKTNAEKTRTDKKRERRKKKFRKRMKLREKMKRQKLLEKTKTEKGIPLSKQAVAAKLKKLTKEGKTTLLKDEGKDRALKSSRAFFSQLQDQVKMQIKGAKKIQKKQREISAQKLKL